MINSERHLQEVSKTNRKPHLRFDLITLFPDMFKAVVDYGVTSRAIADGLLEVGLWNPRDFTADVHRTVDDRPYGGGPGMVMTPGPLQKAIEKAKSATAKSDRELARVIYLSPQGRVVTQSDLISLYEYSNLVLVCGRYEGIDERVVQAMVDEEWSIGDYVLSGGELPAMVLMDALIRLIPGALGHHESASQDSFSNGLLDYPHYTRPEVYAGYAVPPVLLSGNHEKIRSWRLKQSLGRTWDRRPELLEKREMSEEERRLLVEYKCERSV